MNLSFGDKLKFIGCEVLYREACKLAAKSPYRVDVEFLRKGLHDLERNEMNARLQSAIDAVPASEDYKAILLGYARCNDGVSGLTARSIPLVIPKAHDCITFFFGSRDAYQTYFDSHPGTYYRTTGWSERNDPDVPGAQGVMQKLGLNESFEDMVAKYGRENAEFIRNSLGGGLENYTRICYLEMGVTDETPFIDAARCEAENRGWQFDLRKGDWSLLHRLFFGPWNDDFLIVPPRRSLIGRNDPAILALTG